jgi:hypothetical protein
MNSLVKLMELEEEARTGAEERLLKLCEESKNLVYENLIEQLMEITEQKLHINHYKFTSFITWLVEDLEHCKIVNADAWDLNFEQIELKFDDEYWKDQFAQTEKSEWNDCPTWEQFRDEYAWWGLDNCLESVMDGIKNEYEFRDNKGMFK